MPTPEIARYAYPIIEVLGSDDAPVREKKNRTATLKLSLCPTVEPPKTEAITPWQRPATVVEQADVPEHIDPNWALLSTPDSPAAMSYRLLRHRLLALGNPHVIAVTSPSDKEGKTTCALNLALAIGEQVGTRVLLVEANVRSPSLAKSFGFLPTVCFAERLAKSDLVSDPWVMTKLGGSRVELAAVDPQASEHPKLDRALFAGAIKDLRSEYDYIVIDTPSVLDSADVNLISEAVDGVLVVARAKKTRRRALRSALDQLGGTRVLGVTLLDTRKAKLT